MTCAVACYPGSTECIAALEGQWEAHGEPSDPTLVTSRPLVTSQVGVRLTVRYLETPFADQTFTLMMVGPNQLKPLDSGTEELGTVVENGRRINWMRGNWTR